MIEVRIIETGDSAEADDCEAALLAALTLGREAKAYRATHGFNPTITFTVNDTIVRSVTLRDLTR